MLIHLASHLKLLKMPRNLHLKTRKRLHLQREVAFKEKFQAIDQKWSERLSLLEVLIIAKSLEEPVDQPTFQPVKVFLVKQPPAVEIVFDRPFLPPTNQQTHHPTSTDHGPILES